MSLERMAARRALLSAAARYFGLTPGENDGPLRVLIRYQDERALIEGRNPTDEPGWEGPVTLARLPDSWRSCLTLLAGADGPLPAVEIERRLRRSFEGDRATPEISLRLRDLEDAGLVQKGTGGYRLAGRH
jgi:hypothetical protein